MRQVKKYDTREEYLRDKAIMHADKWRPINHISPYEITYIKGNEPENIVPTPRRMSESEYVKQIALKDNIEIT